ncbi:MAG: outer membrane lipoprotein chaperone LolA [Limnohabitans sp.]|nr:outer membrane lipoprotein chaperone LolA [Limnohabitans sp.]
MKKIFLIVSVCALTVLYAQADALQDLQKFLQTTQSGRAQFTQAVTTPAKEMRPARIKTSSGVFAFFRPNQFCFEYVKPYPQMIVADGQTLWLHDVEMNQVTAKAQSVALGNTPVALITTAVDLASLQKDFLLQSDPEANGLRWVKATPKSRDAMLQSIRIGLLDKDAAIQLSKLEIHDAFGQVLVISFEKFEINSIKRDSNLFKFVPPAQAQVIRP